MSVAPVRDPVLFEIERLSADADQVPPLTLADLIDGVHKRGGGFHSLPSGSVKVYLPLPGDKWQSRQFRLKGGETLSAALERALRWLFSARDADL